MQVQTSAIFLSRNLLSSFSTLLLQQKKLQNQLTKITITTLLLTVYWYLKTSSKDSEGNFSTKFEIKVSISTITYVLSKVSLTGFFFLKNFDRVWIWKIYGWRVDDPSSYKNKSIFFKKKVRNEEARYTVIVTCSSVSTYQDSDTSQRQVQDYFFFFRKIYHHLAKPKIYPKVKLRKRRKKKKTTKALEEKRIRSKYSLTTSVIGSSAHRLMQERTN